MKKLLIPLICLIIGTGSGVAARLFVFPAPVEDHADAAPEAAEAEDGGHTDTSAAADASDHTDTTDAEYAKLANQFVVPLLTDGKVTSLVVLSLSLEVPPGGVEAAYAIEPRLRDAFLQVMFDHANVGGFAGNFTDATNMRVLRDELNRSAKHVAGDKVISVLVLDIVRQDI